MQYTWYYPAKHYKNAPSLSKAYAYYEHITLPRHLVGENHSGEVMRRAEPGESAEKTALYPTYTASSSLIEWGIGVDLYFSTVRFMAWILLVAGLLHLPNAMFYASDEYSPDGGNDDLPVALRGSAICTSGAWAVCPTCDPNVWTTSTAEKERFIITDDGTQLVFRNTCDGAQLPQGMVNWVVLVFLTCAIALVAFYIRARSVRFDEDK
jgi:hypothetical protein